MALPTPKKKQVLVIPKAQFDAIRNNNGLKGKVRETNIEVPTESGKNKNILTLNVIGTTTYLASEKVLSKKNGIKLQNSVVEFWGAHISGQGSLHKTLFIIHRGKQILERGNNVEKPKTNRESSEATIKKSNESIRNKNTINVYAVPGEEYFRLLDLNVPTNKLTSDTLTFKERKGKRVPVPALNIVNTNNYIISRKIFRENNTISLKQAGFNISYATAIIEFRHEMRAIKIQASGSSIMIGFRYGQEKADDSKQSETIVARKPYGDARRKTLCVVPQNVISAIIRYKERVNKNAFELTGIELKTKKGSTSNVEVYHYYKNNHDLFIISRGDFNLYGISCQANSIEACTGDLRYGWMLNRLTEYFDISDIYSPEEADIELRANKTEKQAPKGTANKIAEQIYEENIGKFIKMHNKGEGGKTQYKLQVNLSELSTDKKIMLYSNICHCSKCARKFSQNTIVDCTAYVDTKQQQTVPVTVQYCSGCGTFFMNYEVFQSYNRKYDGLLFRCELDWSGIGKGIETGFADDSFLSRAGYSVKSHVSKRKRQAILAELLDTGNATKWEITEKISEFIKLRKTNPDMANAIACWEEDIAFVADYDADEQENIGRAAFKQAGKIRG